ncbi:MAG: alanyl-tRNA editing protein [Gammaproteobacteria bacterium]
MTEELFRQDSYLKECTASVISHSSEGVVLDKTVFYPEGGGQPGDRGVIVNADGESIDIDTTRKLDSGAIEHIFSSPDSQEFLPIGSSVNARIDWDFRYRHMRMHTCLHLLCSLLPYDVTGGSMNQQKGRLDFDMSDTVDKEQLGSALNELIEKGAPVEYQWITDEEMNSNMDLVRTMSVAPPMGQGKVRLVNVDQIDLQPCGGTHVANISEIGAVRVGKVEKKGKQNRRINLHLEN